MEHRAEPTVSPALPVHPATPATRYRMVYLLRLTKIVAGVRQGFDTHAILAPRFDLVEVAHEAGSP
jgi:hypothetical protein